MTWRGSTDWQQRILSVLPYILPLIQVRGFGSFLFRQFPFLELLYIPFSPFIILFGVLNRAIPFIGFTFILFFALYLGVVRNEKLAHFLRFHTMQALLLSIFTFLCLYVFQLVNIPVSAVSVTPDLFLFGVLFSLLFIVVTGACLFSMVQAARGLYAEYPFISEAAYAQTR
ncbi:MAG: hypothetical protein QNJ49_16775 [Mastigocoleus sp. MO_167.B18]|nr:hypothetical protein [Mastigocoleus sp. MO_167.B18]